MQEARFWRRWWTAAAFGAAAAGAAAAYTWWYRRPQEEAAYGSSGGAAAPQRPPARDAEAEAAANLQSHFASIQRISDTTTLPQLLAELEGGLNRTANVDLLIAQLKRGDGDGGSKLQLWQELKLTAWARTLAGAWLLALADLLLRVQLNILGRYIFLQTHLAHPALSSWQSAAPGGRITGRAQELFIEYAHYLPERACDRVLARTRALVADRLGAADLGAPLGAEDVLRHVSAVLQGFEEWAAGEGWAAVALPSRQEAAAYFARFQAAPPDQSALQPAFVESDDDVIGAMVDELHSVLNSARFSAALLAAVRHGAQLLTDRLAAELGGGSLPHAKLLPKVTAAGSALLNIHAGEGRAWLAAVAQLPEVCELCASLYSCKPAPR